MVSQDSISFPKNCNFAFNFNQQVKNKLNKKPKKIGFSESATD